MLSFMTSFSSVMVSNFLPFSLRLSKFLLVIVQSPCILSLVPNLAVVSNSVGVVPHFVLT